MEESLEEAMEEDRSASSMPDALEEWRGQIESEVVSYSAWRS